ncbi:MAG: FeoA family protein [Fimbriimonadaceae bacterium]|nr:ferrous iron transport protein A [Fimbriimonadaceae bacterium]MCL4284872.1 ferrous iron transport protein A [Fimbriimonadaceae bacterium]WKZ80496.1 MAG: FeoA family protein [Fimbriimonadaceae bacterium]
MPATRVSGLLLSEMKPGQRGVIASVQADCPHRRRLEQMGLVLGTEVELLRIAPLGDPIEISLRGYRLCLRRTEASALHVRLLES